jgi:hypothetical protein
VPGLPQKLHHGRGRRQQPLEVRWVPFRLPAVGICYHQHPGMAGLILAGTMISTVLKTSPAMKDTALSHHSPPPCDAAATPPGYRYSDEQSMPCGFGAWKASVDFAAACTPCGPGRTTATATSTQASDCGLAKPGYRLIKNGSTVTGAVACAAGT